MPFEAAALLAAEAEAAGAGADTDRVDAGERAAPTLGILLAVAPGAPPEAEVEAEAAGDEEAAGAETVRREFAERPALAEAEVGEARGVVRVSCLLAVAAAVAPEQVAAVPPTFKIERFDLALAAVVVAAPPFGGTKTASLRSNVPLPSAATVLVSDDGG